MSRSFWKVPYISSVVFCSCFNFDRKVFNTRERNSIVSKMLVDRRFRIYNGKNFISFLVKPGMVGDKLGEYSITKVLGSAISKSMQLKARRKKKSKKSK